MIRPQVSLRMAFWLCFGLAVGIGWEWERYRNSERIRINIALYGTSIRSSKPSFPAKTRKQFDAHFRSLSDEAFRQELAPGEFDLTTHWYKEQVVRAEMVRRGMFADLRARSDRDEWFSEDEAIEVSTAICRAKGEPDPVEVEISFPAANEFRDSEPKVPLVMGELIRKRDFFQGKKVWVHRGVIGVYRDRWRVVLRDVHGREVPPSNVQPTQRPPNHYWSPDFDDDKERYDWFAIDPRTQLQPPRSGRYQLEVVDSTTDITDDSNFDGLIVWRSKPVWVEVENREPQPVDSTLPRFLGILFLAIGCAVFLQRRSWRSSNLWAAAVVILLAAGWLFDARRQQHGLERTKPDQERDWILRPIAAPEECKTL